MIKQFLRFSVILVCFLHIATAQGQSLASLVDSLNAYAEANLREQLYLQTNKDSYETGEDLWFKAYQLDARTLYLSKGSRTLYLQLVRQGDNSVHWQEKYPIENGIAHGQVYIPDSLVSGAYFLQAYSKHSFLANDSSLNSIRKVQIYQKITDSEALSQIPETSGAKDEKHFRFNSFPEGGNLVHGLPTQLAFKASDEEGVPVDITGVLYQDGDSMDQLGSVHDGMGKIRFTPEGGKDYAVKLANGKRYPLPEIYKEGLGLELVAQDSQYVDFILRRSPSFMGQKAYLLGHMGGIAYCGAEVKGGKREQRVRFPMNEFPTRGIAEFTLLDSAMVPVAERLVFVQPQKKLYITATIDDKSYAVKTRGKLHIQVRNEEGNPVKAHLGVSIFDAMYAVQGYPVNIETHNLLSTQIRGHIHHPTYYFDAEKEDRHEALDLLLLTQGWRRYVWHFDGKQGVENAIVLGDGIPGVQHIKKKEFQATEQMLQVLGADESASLVWIDTLGHFDVTAAVLAENRGGYLYLKPLLPKAQGPKLQLKDYFDTINSLRKTRKRYTPFIDSARLKESAVKWKTLASRFGGFLIDEVVVSRKSKKPFRDKYMGRLDSIAQMNLGPWVCEHGYLENYKEGYTHHHNPNYCPNPTDSKTRSLPVTGESYIIFKPKYFESTGSGNRFIVEDRQTIVYNGPEFTDEELLRMNNLWRMKGYYAEREFYLPGVKDVLATHIDTRNSLYWSPAVITDEKGEASITFWTSDLTGSFIGRIEGTDGAGLLGASSFDFQVVKKK